MPRKRRSSFADELARYGPQAAPAIPTGPPAAPAPVAPPMTPRAARAYCRRLARRHYENFTVAARLLPRRLRQHVCNIYAYCRWADDLADEVGDPKRSLQLLDWWQRELRDCYAGQARHPVFIALGETIRQFEIPAEPFIDLLAAFRQDQRQNRYETTDDVLNYCRYSANPVGRLVLYLGRCHTPERVRLSDAVCTGLQLANFCQDVARDWDRGRIYLPLVDCRLCGYDESRFASREADEAFRRLLSTQVDLAAGWLHRGSHLVDLMPYDLRLPVALFVGGGRAILAAIRRQEFDVWRRRPRVSKLDKLKLIARYWWLLQRGKLDGASL